MLQNSSFSHRSRMLTLALLFLWIAQAGFCQGWSSPQLLNVNGATNPAAIQETRPVSASDASGNWVALWEVSSTTSTATAISSARSSNNGTTWSAAISVFSSSSAENRFPSIATNNQGVWIAVWQSSDTLGGTLPGTFNILAARSTDNGATWSSPVVVSGTANTQFANAQHPRIATDRKGTWVVVWDSNNNLGGAVIGTNILFAVSTNNGATWTSAAPVNSDAVFGTTPNSFPDLATDRNGNWVAVWTNGLINPFQIRAASSGNNAASWGTFTFVDTNASTAQGQPLRPSLDTDALGTWIVAYQSLGPTPAAAQTDLDIRFSRSTNNGQAWTLPSALNTDAFADVFNDFDPSIRAGNSGNWIATWIRTGAGLTPTVFFARSQSSGEGWSDPTALHSATILLTSDANPFVATNATGRFITTWDSSETSTVAVGRDVFFSVLDLVSTSTVDLAVAKSADPDPVTSGSELVYTIRVRNLGGTQATGVVANDTLPAGVEFLAASSSQGSCTVSGNTVTCALGTVAGGAQVNIQISVRPQVVGNITNTVTVAALEPDNNAGNNIARVTTFVSGTCEGVDLVGSWSAVQTQCRQKRNAFRCQIRGDLLVQNVGTRKSGVFRIRLFLSDNQTVEAGDLSLGQLKGNPLRPSQSLTRRFTRQLPPNVDPTGKFLIAVLDVSGNVRECNEANNVVVSGAIE